MIRDRVPHNPTGHGQGPSKSSKAQDLSLLDYAKHGYITVARQGIVDTVITWLFW